MNIKLIVYSVIALFILGAGFTIVWSYNNALEGRERAENAAAGWKAATEHWQVEAAAQERDRLAAEKISSERGVALEAANERLKLLPIALDALRSSSPNARAWLDGIIPDDVRRLRRQSAGCSTDLNVPCPNIKPPANSGTSDAGRDRWPDAYRELAAARGTPSR